MKEGWPVYEGCKIYALYSPLYSLLLKQLFCYTVCYWTFFTEIQNKLCTALPLLAPTLLPRAEHPNSPSSNIQELHTTSSSLMQLYGYNSIYPHFYLLIFIFFSIHERCLADAKQSTHVKQVTCVL